MVYIVLSLLLTILAFCGIFTAAIYSLWKQPPVITLPPIQVIVPELTATVNLAGIPTEFLFKSQTLVAQRYGQIGADTDPMPADVNDYCDAESDPLTRDIRKRYARTLRNELGSWALALQALQREDGLEIKELNDLRATTG